MRPIAVAFFLGAAAAPASPAADPGLLDRSHSSLAGSNCPESAGHLAARDSARRLDGLKPQKLGQLPPADTYAAVYQLDERGCMVPVMYREVRALR